MQLICPNRSRLQRWPQGVESAKPGARQRGVQAEADFHKMLNRSREEALDAIYTMAHINTHEEHGQINAAGIA